MAHSLWFVGPESIEIRESRVPNPGPKQVLVRSICSAISAGTEMLAYRNLLPKDIPLDTSIPGMADKSDYPYKYGYSMVGAVEDIGAGVAPEWLGKKVFAFHPHESHFLSSVDDLLPIPVGMFAEDALFIPNMETSINLLLDGAPMIGEKVLVTGLGIVGQLLTALLKRYPLSQLQYLDPIEKRMLIAHWGSSCATDTRNALMVPGISSRQDHFDLVYETSGSPEALDQAIRRTAYHGRLIIGSWYGLKEVPLELGSHFHRSKMSIYASQVSQLDPSLTGRWDKKRRMAVVLDMLALIEPRRLITHQYNIANAAKAYACLQNSKEPVQVILTY